MKEALALNVVVVADKRHIDATVAAHKMWAANGGVGESDADPLWAPGTIEKRASGEFVLDVSKLKPEVKYLVFYVDELEPVE